VQKDFEENQSYYRLQRDSSGLFISLCQKNRQNLSLLESHKLKDSEFIQYSRSLEIILGDNVAGPIIVGTTPTFLKIDKILHKIQQDQIRLFNGLIQWHQNVHRD
jgi:cobalamin biosynthesis Co2+ chelatase CbiK